MRTFEQIEKDLNDIRRELKECIVATLKEKGYGINQIAFGRSYNLIMDGDEDHTCFCMASYCEQNWKHIDFATLDELMSLYATALRAIPC